MLALGTYCFAVGGGCWAGLESCLSCLSCPWGAACVRAWRVMSWLGGRCCRYACMEYISFLHLEGESCVRCHLYVHVRYVVPTYLYVRTCMYSVPRWFNRQDTYTNLGMFATRRKNQQSSADVRRSSANRFAPGSLGMYLSGWAELLRFSDRKSTRLNSSHWE